VRLLALSVLLAGLALGQRYSVTGEAVYRAQAPLGSFQGVNRTLKGEVVQEGERLQGQACIDLSAWDSKEPLRDRHTREMFQVDRYPQACLRLQGVDRAKGLVLGTLTLHGVEKPVAWPVKLNQEGKGVRFQGAFALTKAKRLWA